MREFSIALSSLSCSSVGGSLSSSSRERRRCRRAIRDMWKDVSFYHGTATAAITPIPDRIKQTPLWDFVLDRFKPMS